MKQVLLAALTVLGCHREAPSAPPPASTPPSAPSSAGEAVDESIQMLASASAALNGAADCDARTAALKSWSQQNQAVMSKVRDDLHKWPKADVAAAVQDRMPKHPETKPIFDAAAACKDNAGFVATWKEMTAAMQ